MTESNWSVPVRLLEDLARSLGHSVSEVVPGEAQLHLLNAQRELLLAVAITIEHNTARRHDEPAPRTRRGSTAKRRSASKASGTRRRRGAPDRPQPIAVD